jgi:BA14K-like protein
MINLKVLSAATVIALASPALAPTESFAQQNRFQQRGAGAPAAGGGHVVGAAPTMGGHAVGTAPGMGGGPRVVGANPYVGGGPGVQGGGPRYIGGGGGGHYDGDHYRHRGPGGFFPGVAAGVVIGGALASQGAYDGDGPYYAGTPYYDAPYDYGGTVVEAAPPGDDDAVAYCMQRYRSYDQGSGTFLGNDGLRHPCP